MGVKDPTSTEFVYWLGVVLITISVTITDSSSQNENYLDQASIDDQYDPKVGLDPDIPLELLDFNRYRLNEDRQRYFRVGENHSCSENMRFFAVPNHSRRGQCDCDWFQCSRPLLYHETTGKCYLAWSQGPCKDDEWYTFGEKMFPSCQSRSCPESPDEPTAEFYFQNPEDGKCYEGGTQGYCQYESERLWIYPNEPIPKCRNATVCYPLSVPVHQLCIQGNRYHFQSLTADCSF